MRMEQWLFPPHVKSITKPKIFQTSCEVMVLVGGEVINENAGEVDLKDISITETLEGVTFFLLILILK